jgi:molybdopterin-guanine dinucleotide biosynthesis protein A
VLDQFGDIGPLGGIASCMMLRAYTLYLVVAVDTPQLPITIMRGMLNEAIRGGHDCVMPRHLGNVEPLPSVWHRRALDVILLSIKSERASLRRAAARMNTGYFDYNGSPDDYTGFNTPGEYAARGLDPKQEYSL